LYGEPPIKSIKAPDGGEDLYYIPPRFFITQSLRNPKNRAAFNEFLRIKESKMKSKGRFESNLNGSTMQNWDEMWRADFLPFAWYMDEIVPKNSLPKQVAENITAFYYRVDIDCVKGWEHGHESNIFPFGFIPERLTTRDNVQALVKSLAKEFHDLQSSGVEVPDVFPPMYQSPKSLSESHLAEAPKLRILRCGLSVLSGDNPALAKVCGILQQCGSRTHCRNCTLDYPVSKPLRMRVWPVVYENWEKRTPESNTADLKRAIEDNFERKTLAVRVCTICVCMNVCKHLYVHICIMCT
jgi:hypothetical protein